MPSLDTSIEIISFHRTHRNLSTQFSSDPLVTRSHSLIAIVSGFFANDQLDALFYIFIYYTSLHVSSITALIIRRSNCINKSSGMISLCE